MEKYNELLQCMNSFPIIKKYGPSYEMIIYRTRTRKAGGGGFYEKYIIADLYKKRAAEILLVLIGGGQQNTELFHFQDFYEKEDIESSKPNVQYSDDIINFIYKVMKISFELHSQDFKLPRPTELSQHDMSRRLEYTWNIRMGYQGEDTFYFKLFQEEASQIMIEQRHKVKTYLPIPDWRKLISTLVQI